MSASHLSQAFAAVTLAFLAASVPTRAVAQGCAARTCTAVNRVRVTVPTRLGLRNAGPRASVRANTAWRLEVSPLTPVQSKRTELRDQPDSTATTVRYTLVGI